MGKNGVPDRWEAYSKIGKVVEGTRFVAFKVPLKQSLLDKVSEGVDNKWRIEDLIETVPSSGLGLVIDLTFTTRYYDPLILTSKEIEHKKILTKGHEIPDKKVVNEFYAAVDAALSKEDDKLIGVHCTHGLNRTGYLVCRYMIEKLGLEPEAAIAAFDEARGHNQERQNYINNLKNKGWENAVEEENKQDTYDAWRAARGGGGKMGSDRNRNKNMGRGGFRSFAGGPSGYRSFRGGFNEREYKSQGCHGRTGYEERYNDSRRGHCEYTKNGDYHRNYGDWTHGDMGGYYGSERIGDYHGCYSYEGDACVYTDPATSAQYVWDDSSSSWKLRQSSSDVAKNYVYDGNTYWFKDDTGAKYRWSYATNQWENVMAECPLPKQENGSVIGPPSEVPQNYIYDGNTYWFKDDTGAKYRWNNATNQWENVMAECPLPKQENSSVIGPQSEVPQNYVYDGNTYWFKDDTGAKYRWSYATNQWENVMAECTLPKQDDSSEIGPQSEVPQNYVYDGNTYWFKDDTSAKYRWDNATNQWENAMAECPLPKQENSSVIGPQGPRSVVGPSLPEELPKRNKAAAIRSEAFKRQANIEFKKPKFTKKQIHLGRRRKKGEQI